MESTKPAFDLESRLAAVELRQKGINNELDDIRKIITDGHDVLFELHAARGLTVDSIIERLQSIEVRLVAAFSKLYPRHDDYVGAFERITGRQNDS